MRSDPTNPQRRSARLLLDQHASPQLVEKDLATLRQLFETGGVRLAPGG